MNILFVVDYYQPQLGYGSFYVPRALQRLGHKVTILTSNYYYPFPNYSETAGKILGKRQLTPSVKNINGIRVIRRPMIIEVFTRAIFNGQKEYLDKIKPQIVIVDKTASYQTVIFSIFKSLYKYKLVSIDAHLPSGFKAEGNQMAKEIFYFLFKLLFSSLINKKVDRFIAVQEKTKDIMTRYYGVKNNIVDIPLGTDLNLYKFKKKEGDLIRKRYGIKDNDFVVLYSGKIIKEKGVHILFAAFNELAKKDSRMKILLVGSATKEYEKKCFEMLDRKYHERAIITGFQKATDLYKFYSAADVGVWPLQESMSMNDIASCGVPFIANSTVGVKLRLSNNNALLYKKGNFLDLAKKIDYLYKNDRERREMGKRGRQLMERNFDWKVIASKYIDNL